MCLLEGLQPLQGPRILAVSLLQSGSQAQALSRQFRKLLFCCQLGLQAFFLVPSMLCQVLDQTRGCK